MPALNNEFEKLFLLEFFVESIYIKNSSVEDVNNSSLCVSFQFLNYPIMLVCEEDFTPKTKSLSKGSNVIFRSGKSCLFSLRSGQIVPSEFDLIITLTQKFSSSKGSPEKSLVGQAIVKLGGSFTNLMKNSNNSAVLPITTVKQDTFQLKDKNGEHVGNVAAFVRLSCFGKLIVTQFQLGGQDNQNYMFKGTDPKKIFRDDASTVGPTDHGETKLAEPLDIPGDTPYHDLFGYPKESEEGITSNAQMKDEYEEDEIEEEVEEEGETNLVEETHKAAAETEQEEQKEDYKEIGAEINGHSITIRVLKKNKKKKHLLNDTQTNLLPICSCPPSESIPCPYAPKLNVCDCDYPLPQELIPRCPPQKCCQGSQPLQTAQPCCPPKNPQTFCPSQPPQKSCQGCSPCCLHNQQTNQEGMQMMGCSPQMQNVMNVNQCPREDCPLGLFSSSPQPLPPELEPGTVAMKGDQVIFQMANRPAGEPISEKEKKIANSLYYNVGSTEAGKEGTKNTVQISPQGAGEPLNSNTGGGPVSGLPVDNKQDMFLLKVQQASDGVEAKSKLEMELRTPKTKLPGPDTDTKNLQCVPTDFPALEKKGKGGDKGGKGGKKKK